jgi:hypothetical protein
MSTDAKPSVALPSASSLVEVAPRSSWKRLGEFGFQGRLELHPVSYISAASVRARRSSSTASLSRAAGSAAFNPCVENKARRGTLGGVALPSPVRSSSSAARLRLRAFMGRA